MTEFRCLNINRRAYILCTHLRIKFKLVHDTQSFTLFIIHNMFPTLMKNILEKGTKPEDK